MNSEMRIEAPSLKKLVTATVIALAVACAILIAFVVYDTIEFTRQRVADLSTQATVLGDVCTAALTFDDPSAATDYLSALRSRPRTVEAAPVMIGVSECPSACHSVPVRSAIVAAMSVFCTIA